MKSPTLTLTALLSFCMMPACGDGPSAPTPVVRRTITGVVTEAVPTTDTAVPGARVSIDDGPNAGMSAMTDTAGRYSLTGLIDSTFSLRASAAGYEERAGSLVLAENRFLNFQLLPVRRMVTDTVSEALDVSTCNGETWIVCFAHPFDMHHDGVIETRLTADGGGTAVQLQLYRVTNQAVQDWSNRALEGTIHIGFGPRPAGRYQFRILGRVSRRIAFMLVVTHPN